MTSRKSVRRWFEFRYSTELRGIPGPECRIIAVVPILTICLATNLEYESLKFYRAYSTTAQLTPVLRTAVKSMPLESTDHDIDLEAQQNLSQPCGVPSIFLVPSRAVRIANGSQRRCGRERDT